MMIPDALTHNFTRLGSGFRAAFPDSRVTLDLTKWHDSRNGPSCELTVRCEAQTAPDYVLSRVRWNLTTVQSRRDLAKMATARWDQVDWPSVLELVARKALDQWEAGEPFVLIGVEDVTERPTYDLDPLLLSRQINSWFGKPGSLKGFSSLAAALDVQEGYQILGLPIPDPRRRVLYLDYEFDEATQARRIQALCAGAGKPRVNLAYRRCVGHLADDIEAIAREVADQEIGVVIVDSVEAAGTPDLNTRASAGCWWWLSDYSDERARTSLHGVRC